jgi:hypothetical protein
MAFVDCGAVFRNECRKHKRGCSRNADPGMGVSAGLAVKLIGRKATLLPNRLGIQKEIDIDLQQARNLSRIGQIQAIVFPQIDRLGRLSQSIRQLVGRQDPHDFQQIFQSVCGLEFWVDLHDHLAEPVVIQRRLQVFVTVAPQFCNAQMIAV